MKKIIAQEIKKPVEEVREIESEVPSVEKTEEAKTEGQSSSSTASTDDEKIAKAVGGTIMATQGLFVRQQATGAVAGKAMESIGDDTGNPNVGAAEVAAKGVVGETVKEVGVEGAKKVFNG
ncbi:13543_t:CDS:2 [Funneliformis geosporum]|uniref:13543_t:CDS:1 n=1 Tax=Funneliformis geosporum TaxID=1117311 RepID=A0A9W4WHK2_9GLOM|nr:13543_t:CDS:2 [Funneliformis geosporum]